MFAGTIAGNWRNIANHTALTWQLKTVLSCSSENARGVKLAYVLVSHFFLLIASLLISSTTHSKMFTLNDTQTCTTNGDAWSWSARYVYSYLMYPTCGNIMCSRNTGYRVQCLDHDWILSVQLFPTVSQVVSWNHRGTAAAHLLWSSRGSHLAAEIRADPSAKSCSSTTAAVDAAAKACVSLIFFTRPYHKESTRFERQNGGSNGDSSVYENRAKSFMQKKSNWLFYRSGNITM